MFDGILNIFRKPKGIENPYDYYPDRYLQDSEKSILTPNNHYDLTRFSAHEESVIKQAVNNVKRKYPEKYSAIGLANESYVIVYKPRYILFEMIVIKYKESKNPLDLVAVSFAYESKGAFYRKDAIKYYETVKDRISYKELDKFASVSAFSYLIKIAEAYEKEHEYDKAIECLKILIKLKTGNIKYFRDKINALQEKRAENKPKRKSRMPDSHALFEEQVHVAAEKYIDKFWK